MFQRRILRTPYRDIKWSLKLNLEKVNEINQTNYGKSKKKVLQITWLGHLRLTDIGLGKIAFKCLNNKEDKPQGQKTTTWKL